MQFWPFGLAIFGVVIVAFSIAVLMVLGAVRAGTNMKSPHHRWNLQSDLVVAHERKAISRT